MKNNPNPKVKARLQSIVNFIQYEFNSFRVCTHSQDSFNVSFLSRYRLVVASIWAAWTDPQGAEVTTVALAITGTLSPTIKFLTTCVKIPFYFNGLCIYRKCTSLWSRGLEAFQFVVTLYLNNWKCAFVKISLLLSLISLMS